MTASAKDERADLAARYLRFAAFSGTGFNSSLSVLLWMAMVFSAISGFIKREPPFPENLNHWDEMMGYALILALLGVFAHSLPA